MTAVDPDRSRPVPGDLFYLHLADLRAALEPMLAKTSGRWLDYGSGDSPYRGLLSGVDLWVADLDRPAGPRAIACTQERCDASAASFDGILSTQVLEHVPDPAAYLRESWRLLKPGGTLVLTTHGNFHEHPCPLDVTRWTAPGLRAAVEQAGFEVEKCIALTCGPRAALLLLTIELRFERPRFAGPASLPLVALGWLARRRPALLDRAIDRCFPGFDTSTEGGEQLYVDIVVRATKPVAARDRTAQSRSTPTAEGPS